jgi:hypothetical protein
LKRKLSVSWMTNRCRSPITGVKMTSG